MIQMVGHNYFTLSNLPQYSVAFPRQGESALFSVNVDAITANTTLEVAIQHRNRKDTSWDTLVSFSGITSTGVNTKDASGLKELVRLMITLTGTNADGSVHANFGVTSWRPY